MNTEKCSDFIVGDWEGERTCDTLMRCPKCKGFLPRYFPVGKQFTCKKCKTVLETMPSIPDDPEDEEDSDCEFGGRLCVVPDIAVKKSAL